MRGKLVLRAEQLRGAWRVANCKEQVRASPLGQARIVQPRWGRTLSLTDDPGWRLCGWRRFGLPWASGFNAFGVKQWCPMASVLMGGTFSGPAANGLYTYVHITT